MSGGLSLTKLLKNRYNSATFVSSSMQLLHSNLGIGLHDLGWDFIWMCLMLFLDRKLKFWTPRLQNTSLTRTSGVPNWKNNVRDNSITFVDVGVSFNPLRIILPWNGPAKSPPLHLSSYKWAGHTCRVQILKKGLKREEGETMASRIGKVWMAYRTTPQSTTGVSPSELLQRRWIHTRLDLLKY